MSRTGVNLTNPTVARSSLGLQFEVLTRDAIVLGVEADLATVVSVLVGISFFLSFRFIHLRTSEFSICLQAFSLFIVNDLSEAFCFPAS